MIVLITFKMFFFVFLSLKFFLKRRNNSTLRRLERCKHKQVQHAPQTAQGKHSYLQGEPARYTELGTYPYLETLTLFVSPPTAVSWGVHQAYKKG